MRLISYSLGHILAITSLETRQYRQSRGVQEGLGVYGEFRGWPYHLKIGCRVRNIVQVFSLSIHYRLEISILRRVISQVFVSTNFLLESRLTGKLEIIKLTLGPLSDLEYLAFIEK